jgi:hypothetical protein
MKRVKKRKTKSYFKMCFIIAILHPFRYGRRYFIKKIKIVDPILQYPELFIINTCTHKHKNFILWPGAFYLSFEAFFFIYLSSYSARFSSSNFYLLVYDLFIWLYIAIFLPILPNMGLLLGGYITSVLYKTSSFSN